MSEIYYLHEFGPGNNTNENNNICVLQYPFEIGVWYNIGFTRNTEDKIINFYVDGVYVSSQNYNDNPNGGQDSKLSLGDKWTGIGEHYFVGKLDNIQIWNTVLTNELIENNIQCPLSVNQDGLVGYWNFEEGPNEGQALDNSGNSNNGTINGATYSDEVPAQNCSNGMK